VTGQLHVNKYGRSTNVDSGVDTDLWDRANATHDQDIWLAPTVATGAQLHNITSTSANDDLVGTGARTLRVYGITAWTSSVETTEDIDMDGLSNVSTVNGYVIIHRMQVLTSSTAGPNDGIITATAATDGSVTAQINAGEGQTHMAIYGIPVNRTVYMTEVYGSILKASGGTALADMRLLYNPEPDTNADTWISKYTVGVNEAGSNPFERTYNPYPSYAGPGILKLQATGGAANLDVSGGFDLIDVAD
jgi:hypothetical protein